MKNSNNPSSMYSGQPGDSSNQNMGQNIGNQSGFDSSNASGMMGNLNKIPDMLKKYGDTASKAVGNLSTTQKVIGGAILVLGAGWLSQRSKTDFKNRKNR
jgi:hypothetical protein